MNQTTSNLKNVRSELINEILQRVNDNIIEQSNANLLIKLINNAESETEAIAIAELGTTYKRTGFHFDKRLEKMGTDIKYLKKNETLSFCCKNKGNTHKLIIGDNYDALLNLLITHKGMVDIIYIDPPYGKDSMGEFAQTNYENAITRDNLLSMLFPRLVLAKELLCDGGVIFTSIDDKNYAYIKCLYDDIFGERNFIATYLWKKTETPPSLSKKVRKKYEYILCYGKNVPKNHQFSQGKIDGEDAPLLHTGNAIKTLTFPAGTVRFNIPDGVYKTSPAMKIILKNDVVVENGVNKNSFSASGEWVWGQANLEKELANDTYFIVKSSKFSIRYQKGINDTNKTPPNNIDSELGVGTNEDGDKELKAVFSTNVFSNPKPTSLIKFLIKMVNKDDDIVVLDFFAGSGTTGQAVLELNKEDRGNRNFILCTINEITDTTPNGIAYDVTSKRLKRVMTGKCYDETVEFEWIKNNEALGDNLAVYEIEIVNNAEQQKGLSPFEVIDESCYGLHKFNSIEEKITWVCKNFENTQKYLEEE